MENKSFRLRSRKDFQYLSTNGRTIFGSNWIVLKAGKNDFQHHQIGWTIPKYVGKAVLRNKFKRWLREILENSGSLDKYLFKNSYSYNLNFIFRKKGVEFYQSLDFETFNKNILDVVKKIEKRSK